MVSYLFQTHLIFHFRFPETNMVDALNERINKLQREVIRQEDIDALPPGSYVPILSDIILPSVAMALVFILMRHLFDRYVNMTVLWSTQDDSLLKKMLKNTRDNSSLVDETERKNTSGQADSNPTTNDNNSVNVLLGASNCKRLGESFTKLHKCINFRCNIRKYRWDNKTSQI